MKRLAISCFAAATLVLGLVPARAESDWREREEFLASIKAPSVQTVKAVETTASTTKKHRVSGRPSDIGKMADDVARAHGVPPGLVHGVIMVESRYNCRASNGGARGIMQVLPRTARSVGVSGNLTDCASGLEAGVRYLKQAIALHGAGCAGVSAYQRGLGAPGRCTAYGRKVLAMAGNL